MVRSICEYGTAIWLHIYIIQTVHWKRCSKKKKSKTICVVTCVYKVQTTRKWNCIRPVIDSNKNVIFQFNIIFYI